MADGYDPATGLWCCGVPKLRLRRSRRVPMPRQHWRNCAKRFELSHLRMRRGAGMHPSPLRLLISPAARAGRERLPRRPSDGRLSRQPMACAGIAADRAGRVGRGHRQGTVGARDLHHRVRHPPACFHNGERSARTRQAACGRADRSSACPISRQRQWVALRSDTLASVLTERPAQVRLLGQTRMVLLNSTAFIAVTGNGLTVTEDLARRFNPCELDARCEDPELRPFGTGFLDQIERQRAELLVACLTIWRWGRQNATLLPRGKPLGSFETWAEWCRDPLVALGCRDPVERIEALKANDPRRQRIAELFQVWWEHHGATPIKANQLAEPVKAVADPQGRGRQYLATFIAGLAGTHAAGFVLSRQDRPASGPPPPTRSPRPCRPDCHRA